MLDEQLLNLVVRHAVVLLHACVLEMELLSLLALQATRRVGVRVLVPKHYSMLLGVFVGLVHPTAATDEVLCVTIHELLDRELL